MNVAPRSIPAVAKFWLDVAMPTLEANAALNRTPDAWGVLIVNHADLVVGAPRAAIVVVLSRREFLADAVVGGGFTAPPGMFPIAIIADGEIARLVMSPLITWARLSEWLHIREASKN